MAEWFHLLVWNLDLPGAFYSFRCDVEGGAVAGGSEGTGEEGGWNLSCETSTCLTRGRARDTGYKATP